ncbi:glycosyltransferase family 2 protein [Mesorhizobium loti]|uniref:Glycosyltransferase n=1 Tax=Mesorhizobium loti R88b TaxID=935548 RepID=A0A6M7WKX6_RHILI|nr:glycosyltransferase family 2 protein [Mesorhizobium loti]QKD02525.1 glycosyltransferase [Mesorhizobium loti R88b]
MPEPDCTVIIPTYNRLPYLRKAIASVIAQTFVDWELLVVDDGSTDDTFAAISALSLAEPRLRILRNPGRGGPAGARNAAIVEARGRYIAFLDSDDLWDEDKLAQFMEVAGAEPDAILIGSDYRMIDQVANTSRTACDVIYRTMMPWWETYARTVDLLPCRELKQDRSLLARSDIVFATTVAGFLWIHTSSVLARRDAILAVGGFDESLARTEDIDLWLRLNERGRFIFIDLLLATHDITGRDAAEGERYQAHAQSRRHDEYTDWEHQLALMQRIRERYKLSPALNSLMDDRLDYFHKNCARAAWRTGRRTVWLKHWTAGLRRAIMRRVGAS